MVGFIFGGSTGETPESLKRKRSVAEALASSARAPQNVGEGLTAIGNALVYRALMSEADAGEAKGKESLEADRAAFMGGFGAPAAGASSASVPMTGAAGEVAATSPVTGDTYEPFINTVKEGGLTNPYGLAAVAATGRAESSWDGKKAVGTWSDPSESGQPGTAGGILSWRGPRYQALAATGDLSPQGQAKFFLQEDPELIAKLNSAKSLEEAQGYMNNAWKFAGYDRPGGESSRRLSYAQGYLPKFQGGTGENVEVASLDPSAGMSAADAIDAAAATPSGYVDPSVNAQNAQPAPAPAFDAGRFGPRMNLAEMPPTRADIPAQMGTQTAALTGGRSPVAAALASDSPAPSAPSARSPVAAALASPTAAPQGGLPVGEMATTTGPARVSSGGVTVAQALGSGPSVQQAFKLLNNPYATDTDRAMATMVIKQNQEANNPDNQLDREYKRAQLDALRGKPTKTWQKLDDNMLFNPESGETKVVNAPAAGNGKFRFAGKSVEAQSLNGLMDSGRLTEDQAQQLGAGKTVSGPNGEIIFMTPMGVVGQTADGKVTPMSAPPQGTGQPASEGVDIFGDQPLTAPSAPVPTPPAPPSPPAPPQPPQAPAQRPGMIPLTEPKVTLDENKAAGFADRMSEAEALLQKFGTAGGNVKDQFVSDNAYIPDFAENWMLSDDFQNFSQARRNFINAQLRRESGAVIGQDEFNNARKQYFPEPGDNEEVLKQKAQNRKTAVDAMIRDAGPTYKKRGPAPAAAPTDYKNRYGLE